MRIVLLLLLLTGGAHATVNGALLIEVLGVETAENRLYVLYDRQDDSEEPAEIRFFDLNDMRVGLQRMPKGQRYPSSAAQTALKTRLRALPRTPRERWSVSLQERGQEPCPIYDEARDCLMRDLTVRVGQRARTVRLISWPGKEGVRAVYQLPKGGHLFVYRHMGITDEHGYFADELIILPKRTASVPAAWQVDCAKTGCALRIKGKTYFAAQKMHCAERGAWLACVGRQAWHANHGLYVHRSTGATAPFHVPDAPILQGLPAWMKNKISLTLTHKDGRKIVVKRLGPPRP